MSATPQPNNVRSLRLDATRPAPVAIAVGPWDEREFALVRSEMAGAASWTRAPDVDTAVDQMADVSPAPELVLLAQPYPGYYSLDAALRLERAAPLVRTIVVAGSWCEGEQRTGQPMPGAIRLYWHELPTWWRQAVGRWAAGDSPLWSQPIDEPAVRAWDAAAQRRQLPLDESSQGAVHVLIDAADAAMYDALAAALSTEGCSCTHVGRCEQASAGDRFGIPSTQIIAGVWDGCALDAVECQQLQRFAGRFSRQPAPVIVLVDSPRSQHYARLRAAGASKLLGKPLALGALADELHRLTSSPATSRLTKNA